MSIIEKNRILQHIMFPNSNIVGEKALYFSSVRNGYCTGEDVLEIGRATTVDFDSYFNSFSCLKWKKYTDVDSVSLMLKVQGNAEISLYHNKILYGAEQKILLKTCEFCAPEIQCVQLDFGKLPLAGNLSFSITAKEEAFKIYEGAYISNHLCQVNDVNLAVIFTTYHREEYIKRNLASISSLDKSRIHIYVVDNAMSLQLESCENYTIIPNRNVGGAGGFCRGMIQAIDDNAEKHYSHCILMDDDVLIDPRVFVRLCDFLSKIKTEHQDAFVGGAMFRRDIPYIQVESGAVWNEGEIKSYGHGMDMRDPQNCLYNDFEHKLDYNAWWFCAMPMSYVRNDNLPVPLFVFNDDVDYGLRNKAETIVLNGICVWHDAFESKVTAMRRYYESRNQLIVNSVNNILVSKKALLKKIKKNIVTEIYLYRYENAEAILDGVIDFLKGPEWLCSLDMEEFNKTIIAGNKKMETIDSLQVDYDWYRICCNITDCDTLHKWVRILSQNGFGLRAERFIILPLYANNVEAGYRAKEILYYDEITNTGFYCKRDKQKRKECLRQYRKVRRLLKRNYEKACKDYADSYQDMISREHWEKYLKL